MQTLGIENIFLHFFQFPWFSYSRTPAFLSGWLRVWLRRLLSAVYPSIFVIANRAPNAFVKFMYAYMQMPALSNLA